MDRERLRRELLDRFVEYQYRLDSPMPAPSETQETYVLAYLSDGIFRRKVDSLVAGVMEIVRQVGEHNLSEDY
jgi:hypothetical protein